MALSRAFLKGMGLTEEQVSAIIEAHTETVNGLKETNKNLQTQLDEAEQSVKKGAENNDSYKEKYEKEHADFETYKEQQVKSMELGKKKKAYANLLREAGIKEKTINQIVELTNLDKYELADDGKFKDSKSLEDGAKEKWSEFITKGGTKGADVDTPPANGGSTVTSEQFAKMKYNERVKLHAENPELYNTLAGRK